MVSCESYSIGLCVKHKQKWNAITCKVFSINFQLNTVQRTNTIWCGLPAVWAHYLLIGI